MLRNFYNYLKRKCTYCISLKKNQVKDGNFNYPNSVQREEIKYKPSRTKKTQEDIIATKS